MKILKWLKWPLLILAVALMLLPVLLFAVLRSQGGSCWLVSQAQQAMPDQLSIGRCEGNWLTQMVLSDIHYRDPLSDARVQSLLLDWQPGELWQRHLDVHRLQANGVRYETLGAAEEKEAEPSTFTLSDLILPVTVDLRQVEVNGLELVNDEGGQTVQQLTLSASTQRERIQIHDLRYVAEALDARVDAQFQLESAETFRSELNWQVDVTEQGHFAGQGTITGSLKQLQFDHALNQPFSVTSAGRLDLSGDEPGFDVSGTWTDVRWPLQQTEAFSISSQQGRYQLAGTASAYHLAVDTAVRGTDIPPIQLDLTGDGNTEQIQLTQLDITALQGISRLRGLVAWAPGLRFDLALKTDPLHLADAMPDLPGVLAAQLSVKGHMDGEVLTASVDIQDVSGQVRNYPLAASGQVAVEGTRIDVNKLLLTSGTNRVQVNGFVNQVLDLNIDIQAPQLAAFWPGLEGQVMGQAQLDGTRDAPALDVQLSSEAVRFEDYQLAKLDVDVQLDLQADGHLKADIQASNLQAAGETIESVELKANGGLNDHRFSAQIKSDLIQLETALTGAYQNGNWLGEWRTLNLNEPHAGAWHLKQLAHLQVRDLEKQPVVQLRDFCLQQEMASLCADGTRSADGAIDAKGALKSLPLSLARAWLPPDLSIDGAIDMDFKLSQQGEALTAQLDVLPQPGVVTLQAEAGEQPLTFRYEQTEIHANLVDGNTDLRYQIHFPQAGHSTGEIHVDAKQSLKGTVQAELPDLAPFAVFVPTVRNLQGDLVANVGLAGSTEQPLIDVDAALHAGLQVPEAGLELQQIEFTARNEATDRVRLSGSVRSGEGDLQLDGTVLLQPEAGWPLQLSLVGDRFQAVRVPEADVLISPDLKVSLDSQGTVVNGTLSIPEAHIEIQQVPESAVAVSEDEVIIDGLEIDEKAVTNAPGTRAKVTLKLGEEVHFKGFGLTTRLRGNLEVSSEAGKTLAQGIIKLKEGQYKSYGQDLTLERGQFAFAGPVDNPELDIRATRTATSGDVVAVLQVTGPAKAPQSRVFSEPPLPQVDALSYLLTGKPLGGGGDTSKQAMLAKAALGYGLKQAGGIAQSLGIDEIEMEGDGSLDNSSVVLGKYLTPDLYVGYVASLFGSNTGVLLKYRINKYFSMETRAGTSQSVDALYNYEMD